MQKVFAFVRFIGAVAPFLAACYGGIVYAQELESSRELMRLERRVAANEIDTARQEERWHAVVARLDAQDKTLWWLIVATFGGTGVSGVVAVDRATYKFRAKRQES